MPADIRACFRGGVQPPEPFPVTRKAVAALVAEFKRSENRKNVCGQRLVAWYQAQADTLAGR